MVIRGSGGGSKSAPPAAPPAPVEAPNTLFGTSYARVVGLIGEGPIQGLIAGSRSIYVDGTPITNPNGSTNYAGITYDTRNGYPDQSIIPGFPAVENEVAVDSDLTFNNPITITINDLTATRVRLNVIILQLFSVDTSTGNQHPTDVVFSISRKDSVSPSFTTVRDVTVVGKTISPVPRSYVIDLTGTGPWQVRLTRVSQDSDSTSLGNGTRFSSYTIISDYRLNYADSAIISAVLPADTFGGNFPEVEVEVGGLLLKIPNNYNPTTGAYSGVWDGNLVTSSVAVGNPAWVLYNMIENNRWGLGDLIDLAHVNKFDFYEAGKWCDELVPDGRGGVERRFQMDGVIDSSEEAFRVLSLVAGAFRSMIYWGSGAIRLVPDRPTDPVRQLNRTNVKDGKFNYVGSGLSTRPTAAYVKWKNPTTQKWDIEPYEDLDKIDTYGLIESEPVSLLNQRQGQAARQARWEIETAWVDNDTVTYITGHDNAGAGPGEIVDIADPSIQGFRLGGRLISAVDTTLTIDAPVLLDPLVSYSIKVIDETLAVQVKDLIVTVHGETSTLTIDSPLDPAPMPGAVWNLTSSQVQPRRFRILAVEESSEEDEWKFTGLFHDQNKQTRIENNVIVETPSFTAYPTGGVPAPTGLSTLESIARLSGGTYRHITNLSWTPPSDPRVTAYQVRYKKQSDIMWTDAGRSGGTTAELRELGDGSFSFQVRSIAFDLTPSPWSDEFVQVLVGLTAPPPDVENFRGTPLLDFITLSWTPVDVPNVSHYEIRFSPDTNVESWESAVVLIPQSSAESIQVPNRAGVYLIKAVTAQGVYSLNPTLLRSDTASLLNFNVVEVVVCQPNWLGTREQVSIDPDRQALKLSAEGEWFDRDDFFDWEDWFGPNGVFNEGIYTIDPSMRVDLGAVYTSRISATLHAYGERINVDVFSFDDVFAVDNIFGEDPAGWSVELQYRTTDIEPALSPDVGWSEWKSLIVSDVTARAFDFRLILRTTDQFVTPIVEQLEITVDMPDRTIAGNDLVVPIEGRRVEFIPAFKGFAGLAIVEQDLDTGDYPVVTNKNTTGFDIIFRNSSGAAVERTIDFVAKGHGVEL